MSLKTLISADCTASTVYKSIRKKYTNPITNVFIKIDEYIKLIENYDTLNFDNFKPIINPDDISDYDKQVFKYNILIDDKVFISFPYECDEKLMIEKYLRRLERYKSKEYEIVFVFTQREYVTEEDLMKFINVKTNHKKILFTKIKELEKYNTDNLSIIYDDAPSWGSIIKCCTKVCDILQI